MITETTITHDMVTRFRDCQSNFNVKAASPGLTACFDGE